MYRCNGVGVLKMAKRAVPGVACNPVGNDAGHARAHAAVQAAEKAHAASGRLQPSLCAANKNADM
jgi:hypothetical protein